jgi:hypothetical protein
MKTTPSKVRISKSALFEQIRYEPHAGQLLVHRSTASRRVVSCGVRWGKSTLASVEIVAALLQPRRDVRGWTVAPSYNLTGLVFDRVVHIFEQRFPHRIKSISARDRSLTVVNLGGGRSTLEAKSADNPSSLLGESLDFVVIDEAATLKEFVWTEHVSQRLLDRAGWALLVSTPNGRNWFAKLHRRGQRGRDKDFESWSMPSWENLTLDRALIEAERARLGDEAFRAQYGGEFVGRDLEPCDVCGGPDPNAPAIALLLDSIEHPLCIECRKPVNQKGRSVVKLYRDGRTGVMALRLTRPESREVPQSDLPMPAR